jgi:hypothetical protein
VAYAAHGDVTARLPAVKDRITADSDPSTTNVTDWITYAEAEINSTLTAIGVTTVPVDGADAIEVLKGLACDYAEGRLRLALDTNNAGEGDDGQTLIDRFFERLDKMRADSSHWVEKLSGTSGAQVRVKWNDNNDEDGPDFDRDFES